VIDAGCGRGKTSYCIQRMNDYPDKSYIYITPFLAEVERVKTAKQKNFMSLHIKMAGENSMTLTG